jgi:hypothetical protein
MECEGCKKELMGGFKTETGFQCAECAIQEVEVGSIISAFERIKKYAEELNEKPVEGRQYKDLSSDLKTGIREIAHLCEFIISNNSILNKKGKS